MREGSLGCKVVVVADVVTDCRARHVGRLDKAVVASGLVNLAVGLHPNPLALWLIGAAVVTVF